MDLRRNGLRPHADFRMTDFNGPEPSSEILDRIIDEVRRCEKELLNQFPPEIRHRIVVEYTTRQDPETGNTLIVGTPRWKEQP